MREAKGGHFSISWMAQIPPHITLEQDAGRQPQTSKASLPDKYTNLLNSAATATYIATPATHPTLLPGLLSDVMALLRAEQAGSARICWESKVLGTDS